MSTSCVTPHALSRVEERLLDLGFDPDQVFEAALRFNSGRDYAVCVATLPREIANPWEDGSNGDTVWVIVRGGRAVTVMLRRRTQSTYPAAFRVSAVYFAQVRPRP